MSDSCLESVEVHAHQSIPLNRYIVKKIPLPLKIEEFFKISIFVYLEPQRAVWLLLLWLICENRSDIFFYGVKFKKVKFFSRR